jgi:molybdopterin synthase catalytic subunit/molybdopterin converting factor small subunit
VAKRDQLRRPLGGHDAGDFRYLEDVAFGITPQRPHCRRAQSNAGLSLRLAKSICLARHIDHLNATIGPNVAQGGDFVTHDCHATSIDAAGIPGHPVEKPKFAPKLGACHTRPMRVRVLLFGPLAELYGVREEWLELNGSPVAADVYRHYRERDARIGQLEKSLHLAVNQVVVSSDHALAADDEVALLPPVCGGSVGTSEVDLIDLVDIPLEPYAWRTHLVDVSGSFGAITSFEGLVRNEDEADPVIALSFDAYRPMAISALNELAAEGRRRWSLQSIVMLHRLGTVPAGDVCVVVAVSTGHRDEAFAACRFLIDTLKATVPIWKKEITASTSRWVEGVLLPIANETSSPLR